jgi:hypothetical protein
MQLLHTGRQIAISEKESLKYERAAMRWLERYITESLPGLANFAKVTRKPCARCSALRPGNHGRVSGVVLAATPRGLFSSTILRAPGGFRASPTMNLARWPPMTGREPDFERNPSERRRLAAALEL